MLLDIECQGYVLALDPDDAGRLGIYKLGNYLIKNKLTNVYVPLLPEGKDINDLSHEEFKQVQVVSFKEWLKLYKIKEEQ